MNFVVSGLDQLLRKGFTSCLCALTRMCLDRSLLITQMQFFIQSDLRPRWLTTIVLQFEQAEQTLKLLETLFPLQPLVGANLVLCHVSSINSSLSSTFLKINIVLQRLMTQKSKVRPHTTPDDLLTSLSSCVDFTFHLIYLNTNTHLHL